MKTFVLGDLHGAHKALLQVFEKSDFDFQDDRLILLGDIVDGYPETYDCVQTLLTVQKRVFIRGNHDQWFMEYFEGYHPGRFWTDQGGFATLESYKDGVPVEHKIFFHSSVAYFIDEKNRLFVHGGFNPSYKIDNQNPDYLMWDRDLVETARRWEVRKNKNGGRKIKLYEEVFVGHTTTSIWTKEYKPIRNSNLWMLDTGAGFEGKLTLMDVDTKEYWQSDRVKDLYPGIEHTRGLK